MPIIDDNITAYLENLIPQRSPVLLRLEAEAREEGIPNISLAGAYVLRMLCALRKPEHILEIGTAIGYSALHMAEAAEQARIVTIELKHERAVRALSNFHEAGVAERIKLLEGDASAHLPQLSDEFDIIFIDAAKGQYSSFLQESLRLCRPGGIIVSDNVLFRGWAAELPESLDRRHRSLVRKIRDYNELLRKHPGLETTFLSVGDGMAVSIKR